MLHLFSSWWAHELQSWSHAPVNPFFNDCGVQTDFHSSQLNPRDTYHYHYHFPPRTSTSNSWGPEPLDTISIKYNSPFGKFIDHQITRSPPLTISIKIYYHESCKYMGISTAYIVLAVGLLIKNNKAKYVIKDKTKHVQLISIENAKSQ